MLAVRCENTTRSVITYYVFLSSYAYYLSNSFIFENCEIPLNIRTFILSTVI